MDGLVAGGDDRLEGAALVLDVALGGFHQVGDQVEAALQLHVDLGEGIFISVATGDQAVVHADEYERQNHNQDYDDDGYDQSHVRPPG